MPMRPAVSPPEHLAPVSRRPLRVAVIGLFAALAILAALRPADVLAQRPGVMTRSQKSIASAAAMDAGTLPGSQTLTITLRLAPSEAQERALDQVLAAQLDRSSPLFRQWLTPAEFAVSFGATDEQVARLSSWLSSNGLTVTSVSPAKTRISVIGSAALIESAFNVSLRRMSSHGNLFFANQTEPTVPPEFAGLVAGISGFDDLPSMASANIRLVSSASPSVPATSPHLRSSAEGTSIIDVTKTAIPDPLVQLAAAVDANATPVLTLASTACATDLSAAEIAEFRALLRQANAQGVTIVATSACPSTVSTTVPTTIGTPSFPSALSEVTAITLAPPTDAVAATTGLDTRPSWQSAPGLPADALRHEPDLTTASAPAFTDTVTALNREVGSRVGNINSTLYALSNTPGLFAQPDVDSTTATTASSAGNWSAATGLGTIDVVKLLKVFPRTTAAISTITGVQSSSYAVNYGDSFTLTGKVIPVSYGTANPTGTVSFTASSQGTLGSSTIDGNGDAFLIPDVLPVGSYAISAVYSGDGNYSGSASTVKATVTISPVTAKITATVSPATQVPYGATATATVTVALPGANAAPSGPVSAQIEGITGAFYSATLSPNPGGNTATANIVLSIPSPGSYEIDVTCQGTTNYQCQTPPRIPLTTVKGYTNTSVSVTPAAPQAGQPISLTATVANAGNGSGTYTYNGSVSFYDSGKLLATAPVATNQATTTLALSGNRTHNIIAVYTGDSNWNTSTSGAVAVTPTILPDALTLSSTVSGTNSLSGVNIIFTGTTTTNITYGTGPTGTITFFDTFNGAVVQLGNAATLVANGPTASIGIFTTTGLQPGTHRIYAQYSGDNNYAATTSAVLVLSLSDFSVTMTPTTLSLAQGKSQQVTVFVGTSGGFGGTVSLGCTPPPSSQATCSFAPSSVVGGGATTLTITTTAPSAATSSVRRAGLVTASGSVALTVLTLLMLPRRRRAIPSLLAIFFGAALLSANLGCGLGVSTTGSSGGSGSDTGSGALSSGSSASDGTPLGTQNYSVTAAGSDGVNTIRHTYQYQVTVQ